MKFYRATHSCRFVAGAALSILSLSFAGGAALSACGAGETTGSKRVSLKTHIVADDGVDAPFLNAFGWSVKLSKAALSVGALYYFDGATIFSAGLPPARPGERFAVLLGVGTAWAHPGHYQAGNAMGQVLLSSSVDLALGPSDLPLGEGVAGIYRSGRFIYEKNPTGSAALELAGHVVVLEGEATKDTMKRVFRASALADEVLDASGEPRLEGCAFDGEPDVQEDGTITVHVKPSIWLDQAEFDTMPESADGAPLDLPKDSEVEKAFIRGLKKGTAIVFSYSTP
jgi:hypothetical protein